MKIAVIGSRNIAKIDWERVGARPGDSIISGGAKGVDTLAEAAAREHGLGVETISPNFARYGRGAPHVRNMEIVSRCDRLVAFWNGESKGTKSTIDAARKAGKPTTVISV